MCRVAHGIKHFPSLVDKSLQKSAFGRIDLRVWRKDLFRILQVHNLLEYLPSEK
jgi:hypothetical protein